MKYIARDTLLTRHQTIAARHFLLSHRNWKVQPLDAEGENLIDTRSWIDDKLNPEP
jgi:hypothetical protein